MFYDNESPSIRLINFFDIEVQNLYQPQEAWNSLSERHSIDASSNLLHQTTFADVRVGWNEMGLLFHFKVRFRSKQSFYPNITEGESIEIFIDTRNLKNIHYNTRFCHHFYFLPFPVESPKMGEITEFKFYDKRPLCSPEDLKCEWKYDGKHYSASILIPQESLCGFDPSQFSTIGFNYRVNRKGTKPQDFSASSEEYKVEELPSIWSTMHLVQHSENK